MKKIHCITLFLTLFSIKLQATRLIDAISSKNTTEALFLLGTDYGSPNEQESISSFKNTPLMLACSLELINVVEALVAHPEIEINKQNTRAITALMLAAKSGNIEIIKILLSHRSIDTSLRDFQGKSALEWAQKSNNPTAIKLFSPKSCTIS